VTTRIMGLALALLAAALVPACAGVRELRADQLSIVAPAQLARVELPTTVRWTTKALPDSVSRFAVFVDRGPMAPGGNLRSLADDACRARPGCPDADYLRTLGIYVTDRSSFAIPAVLDVRGAGAHTAHPVHRAVVVALDDHGRRVGGFSAQATFRLDR
jgi:hypothetical protein